MDNLQGSCEQRIISKKYNRVNIGLFVFKKLIPEKYWCEVNDEKFTYNPESKLPYFSFTSIDKNK